MAIVTGTNFADFISVNGPPVNGENTTNKDDVVSGLKGNDVILGGFGADLLGGDQGNDVIYGDSQKKPGDFDPNNQPGGNNSEDDIIFGGGGADTLFGEDDDDSLYGGGGGDLLFGGVNDDLVSGDGGNDKAFGDSGDDDVRGGAGNDTAAGNDGDDSVNGGAGNDQVFGDGITLADSNQRGNDIVNGGLGNDVLRGDGPAIGLLGNIGLDIFEWDQSSVSGTSTASNVEVDTILDFHALPTIVDGILGIDHIDLSSLIDVGDYLADPARIKIVGGNNGDGFLQVLVDTNDDSKGNYDLKINVFTNSDANWNIGVFGNSNAEIWL